MQHATYTDNGSLTSIDEPMQHASSIRTKARVADHGEVFTGSREIQAMLDLVKPQTERIDSTFLEPACGTGNFLAEILRRKLNVCHRLYGRKTKRSLYERWSLTALMSIYGV